MKLQKIFESWRKFLKENEKKPEYTAYVVSDSSMDFLREKLGSFKDKLPEEKGWKFSETAVHGNEQLNHHITINLGAAKEDIKPMLGETVNVKIDGFGFFDGKVKKNKTTEINSAVAAWKVDTSSLPIKGQNEVPHITAAIKKGEGLDSKPMHSNSISSWEKITPFNIECVIEEVFSK